MLHLPRKDLDGFGTNPFPGEEGGCHGWNVRISGLHLVCAQRVDI